jgi:hypothetical protein
VLLALAVLLTAGSCSWLGDRFRTCRSLRVDLVNNRQARFPVHIASEDESFSDATYLESGATRRIVICVERGDRKSFRAMRDGEVVGSITCVVSRDRAENEASVARVEWGPDGFRCQSW